MESKFSARENNEVQIGGRGVIELANVTGESAQPHFRKATILPGRGMNTFQLESFLPGHGAFNVFDTLALNDAMKMFAKPDPYGNYSFKCGGAFLIPYGNRIRGKMNWDRYSLKAEIAGKEIDLPANWQGEAVGAERHAMHGLILNSKPRVTSLTQTSDSATVTAELEAGDFGSNWPSKTDLSFKFSMSASRFSVRIEAKNVGDEPTPIGIGWHPYFAFPSEKREQVRVHVPAKKRTISNNLDDVFPTGEIVEVQKPNYDFSAPEGAPLGKTFYDDAFLDFNRDADGGLTVELVDPIASYGVRVRSSSETPITNFQFFAPPHQPFTSIEPQTNMPDPFSDVWAPIVDRGMPLLNPGATLTYAIDVELFTPS